MNLYLKRVSLLMIFSFGMFNARCRVELGVIVGLYQYFHIHCPVYDFVFHIYFKSGKTCVLLI